MFYTKSFTCAKCGIATKPPLPVLSELYFRSLPVYYLFYLCRGILYGSHFLQAQVLQGNKGCFHSLNHSCSLVSSTMAGIVMHPSMFSLTFLSFFATLHQHYALASTTSGVGGGETCLKILGPSSLSLEKEIEKILPIKEGSKPSFLLHVPEKPD